MNYPIRLKKHHQLCRLKAGLPDPENCVKSKWLQQVCRFQGEKNRPWVCWSRTQKYPQWCTCHYVKEKPRPGHISVTLWPSRINTTTHIHITLGSIQTPSWLPVVLQLAIPLQLYGFHPHQWSPHLTIVAMVAMANTRSKLFNTLMLRDHEAEIAQHVEIAWPRNRNCSTRWSCAPLKMNAMNNNLIARNCSTT